MKNEDKLEKIKKQYEKVCDKIEQLNQEAFELEKEMTYRNRKNKEEPNYKEEIKNIENKKIKEMV